MVDPNRKINRLTDKDLEFLDECEVEFLYRFTDEDEEFVKHCSQAISEPPVVSNWSGNKPFNRNTFHNNRGGNYRSDRRWNNNHRRGVYNRDQHPRRDNWNNSR